MALTFTVRTEHYELIAGCGQTEGAGKSQEMGE